MAVQMVHEFRIFSWDYLIYYFLKISFTCSNANVYFKILKYSFLYEYVMLRFLEEILFIYRPRNYEMLGKKHAKL